MSKQPVITICWIEQYVERHFGHLIHRGIVTQLIKNMLKEIGVKVKYPTLEELLKGER